MNAIIANKIDKPSGTNARLATLNVLRKTTVANYLDPVPCSQTLRAWFDAAGVPRLQANPGAKRGGGVVYYHVGKVEQFLKGHTTAIGGAN